MTWSKSNTSSAGFLFSDYSDPSRLDNNSVVLGEWVGWLVSRGWTVTSSDTSASGTGTHEWRIKKTAAVEGGGNRVWALVIKYTGNAGGYDRIEMYPTNGNGTNERTNIDLIDNNFFSILEGTWTFWISDQDTDSFLVMNQDNNQVIGFWPPSGSFYNAGSVGTDWPRAIGTKPLYIDGPCWTGQASDSFAEMRLMLGASTANASSYTNTVPMKLDFVAVCASSGKIPIFQVNGGDMSSLVFLGSGDLVESVLQATGKGAGVTQIGSDYYISWGEESQLLFNCGTSAPVF